MSHLLQRFRRDIIGLVWLATGIFLGLALGSYNPSDPSFNTIGNDLVATNYCGYVGSFVADLFYQGLGLVAWLFVAQCLHMACQSFFSKEFKLKTSSFFWGVSVVVIVACLGALYLPDQKFFKSEILAGGLLGLVLTEGLTEALNSIGVAVVLWTMITILLMFYTERGIVELLQAPATTVKKTLIYSGRLLRWIGLLLGDLVRSVRLPALAAEGVGTPNDSPSLFRTQEKELSPQLKERFFPIPQEDSSQHQMSFEISSSLDDQETTDKPKKSLLFSLKKLKGSTSEEKDLIKKKRKVQLKKKVQRRIENWELPKLSLLEDPPASRKKVSEREIRQKSALLTNKLEQFSVKGSVVGVKPGPAVTLFEFKPNVDVKISKITDLADDLSLALSSESVRIIAPIPGRDVVGIETSNTSRETVYLKDILADNDFWEEDIHLPIALGHQADGTPKVVDLRKMPHLLVAGSTGSGKSVFTVSLLVGLLFRHSPKSLKLILVDPKQVDLAAFNELPHLLMPPIRDTKKAICSLKWAIKEMEKRYRSMSKFGARGLESFNKIVTNFSKEDLKEHEEFNESLEGVGQLESYYYTPQPYIVIVVEEFGDLMAVDKSNVEQAVVRLAQMARACGIHLILAMQSPRKDVVTGLIKTNIPGRVSFKVASKMDSRIILDESGAERLLTRGDMLFLAPGVPKPQRHHGPWLSEEEINSVCHFWRGQGEPDYDEIAMKALDGSGGGFDLSGEASLDDEDEYDERYDEVVAYVSTQKEVSASLLQRRFRLGYPRAARLIQFLESEGVVGPAQGSKPRQVLVKELK